MKRKANMCSVDAVASESNRMANTNIDSYGYIKSYTHTHSRKTITSSDINNTSLWQDIFSYRLKDVYHDSDNADSVLVKLFIFTFNSFMKP